MNTISNQNLVFCPPLLGKLNSAEDKPLNGPDTRSRVLLKEQKGPLCAVHVLDLVRDREKASNTVSTPTQEATPKRKFEMIVSERSKAIRESSFKVPDIANTLPFLHSSVVAFLKRSTKANIETSDRQENINQLDATEGVKIKLSSIIAEFKEQKEYTILFDYLSSLPKAEADRLVSIDEEFLKKANQDLSNRLASLERVLAINKINSAEMLKNKKGELTDAIAIQVIAENYGFSLSSWNTTHTHDRLMQELQSHGPMIVIGKFGSMYYEQPPVIQKRTIQGRPVYGWPSGSSRLIAAVNHSIVIVGAEKYNNLELVYYIDPIDPSNPNDISTQRIFVMSYARLTDPTSIFDIFGIKYLGTTLSPSGTKVNGSSPFGYMYYYNRPSNDVNPGSLPIQLSNLNIDENKKQINQK